MDGLVSSPSTASNGSRPTREVILIRASAVPPASVVWIWRDRAPSGALTVVAGRAGLGKTQLAIRVVADLTTGRLPGSHEGRPATCLFATAEDSLDAVLVPRLIAAEADLARVEFVTARRDGIEDVLTLPDDAEALARRAEEVEAALLVIDPLSAFLPGNTDSHKDADVRRALAPLARVASERSLGILAVTHLNKATGSDALTRVSGSGAFTAAPRSVLIFGVDPDDADEERGNRRILAHAKSNLGRLAPSLRCQIENCEVDGDREVIRTSRLNFAGESDHSARDVLSIASDEERSARGEAAEFLRETLSDAPIRSTELFAAAKEAGISESTLRRAQKDLGIQPEQKGDGWYWPLPDEAAS